MAQCQLNQQQWTTKNCGKICMSGPFTEKCMKCPAANAVAARVCVNTADGRQISNGCSRCVAAADIYFMEHCAMECAPKKFVPGMQPQMSQASKDCQETSLKTGQKCEVG